MPEIIQCPSCQRELQVPEDFIGKPVKCPACGLNFVTSKESQAQPLRRASEVLGPSAVGSVAPATAEPPGRGLVIVAAIALLIFAIAELAIDVFQSVFVAFVDLKDFFQRNPNARAIYSDEQLEQMSDPAMITLIVLLGSICGIMALVTIVGAIQMMRLRTWGLALAGAICPLFHINSYCCCLGGEFVSLFAIIVLCLPNTRALFQHAAAADGSPQDNGPGARTL
jgi:hypothetical protein